AVRVGSASPGACRGLHPGFARVEETGRVRRGYFIEHQGGAQFASPGAVDRLRNARQERLVALASTDPANPYGAALAWPESDVRLARVAGSYVLIADGELAGYLEKGGRSVHLWAGVDADEVAAVLADLAG